MAPINADAHLFVQGVKEYNGLDSLAETHLVGKDSVRSLRPGKPQPVEALQLIRMQSPTCRINIPRLLVKFHRRLQKGRRGEKRHY